ncbi:PEP-CTERM protein-sorting domain-containing protein [Novosphingobium sp. 9U]|nr:nidogen-like domain-containing protein [Novosphingobium sp. 9U]VWX54718.1 PEP-CTERM protein-sorting domain-containing protein [Novosphingobium sp. 9U]
MTRTFTSILALAALALPQAAPAATLLTNSDGGYGQIALPKNDDSSSGAYIMPFSIDFFGSVYDELFVNNNGNVTFSTGLGSFTPFDFGSLGQAMIAPFWADVDTRCVSCGNVYIGSFAPGQINVTWDNVGYYSQHSDKLNSFQLNLYQSGNAGDFDIEFRYADLNWTTGDASQGVNGLGGVPAAAGYTNGAGATQLQPGSFLSPGALSFTDSSNVGEDGRWVYNIRNDAPPTDYGASPENPVLPTEQTPGGGYEFTFEIDPTRPTFIDPPVATGYDFGAEGGALFTSAVFTSLLNDSDGYQLYDGANLLGQVAIGQTFTFASPLAAFQLRGIDSINMLQPGDPLAFVSGFTFDRTGTVTVTQNPYVQDVAAAVPETATWAMMILGIGMVGGGLRRRPPRARFA